MAKATIVSIYPKDINERKPGIHPGQFIIPAAKLGEFSSLIVDDAFFWIDFAEPERKPIKQIVDGFKLATAVVEDFCRNIPGYRIGENYKASPGMFVIAEAVTPVVIAQSYKPQLAEALVNQNNWFKQLVTEADDTWEKTRTHRAISSLQRLAAKNLGLEKEWIVETVSDKGIKFCPACRTRVHPDAVVCSSCQCILDEDKYAKMKFVQKG